MKKNLKTRLLLSAMAFCMAASAQPFVTSSLSQQNINNPVTTAATNIIHSGDIVAYQYYLPPVPQTASPTTAQEETFALNVNSVTAYTANGSLVYPNAGSWTWTATGDVRFIDASGKIQSQITGVTSVTAFNYNNQIENYPDDLGQSKGRITLTWSYTNTCNNVGYLSFDLDKEFNNSANAAALSQIWGNTFCLQPNQTYTFFVDPIMSDNLVPFNGIPIDEYNWVVTGGSGLTGMVYSGDHSSIKFTTGATVPTSISCYFGRANGGFNPGTTQWQTNTSLQAFTTRSFNVANFVVPQFYVSYSGSAGLSTPASVCLPLTNRPNPCVINITNPQAGCTYQWVWGTDAGNNPNAWQTTPTQAGTAPYTTNAIMVSGAPTLTITNMNNQPGYVKLIVTDQCGNTETYPLQINRADPYWTAPVSSIPEFQSLVTLSSTCILPTDVVTASVVSTGATAANLNNFTWHVINPTGTDVSANWNIQRLSNGNYTITPPSGVTQGSYTLYVGLPANNNGGSCYANPSTLYNGSLPITLNIRPASVTVTGTPSTCLALNTLVNLIASPTNAATGVSGSYTWTSSDGASIFPEGSTASGQYKYGGNGLSPITITATYLVGTGCTTSGTTILTPAPPNPTVTVNNACAKFSDGGVTLHVSNPPSFGNSTLNLQFWTEASLNFVQTGITAPLDASGNVKIPFASGVSANTGGDGAYVVSFNSSCPGTGMPAIVSTSITPASVAISGNISCMSNGTASVLTASPAVCASCAYSWATTTGSVSPATGNPTTYTSNGTVSSITATYGTVNNGCKVSSSPVTTMLTPGSTAPIIGQISCVGNTSGSQATIPILNPATGSGVTYTLTYTGTNTGDVNILSISNPYTLINGNNSITVPVTPVASTPGTLVTGHGTYTLTINSNCGAGSASTPFILNNTPLFTVGIFSSGQGTQVGLSTSQAYVPYTWWNSTTNTELQNNYPGSTYLQTLIDPSTGANDVFGAQATVNGCTYRSNISVTGYVARPAIASATSPTNALPEDIGAVYPNPNNGTFIIDLITVNDKASAVLYDITGKAILDMPLVQGQNKLAGARLVSGNYILITTVDGETYTNQITVSN